MDNSHRENQRYTYTNNNQNNYNRQDVYNMNNIGASYIPSETGYRDTNQRFSNNFKDEKMIVASQLFDQSFASNRDKHDNEFEINPKLHTNGSNFNLLTQSIHHTNNKPTNNEPFINNFSSVNNFPTQNKETNQINQFHSSNGTKMIFDLNKNVDFDKIMTSLSVQNNNGNRHTSYEAPQTFKDQNYSELNRCMQCNTFTTAIEQIFELQCGCRYCKNCLMTKIDQSTDGKVVMNKMELSSSKLKKVKCICGINFDVEYAIAVSVPNIELYIQESESRLSNYVSNNCLVCRRPRESLQDIYGADRATYALPCFDENNNQINTHLICRDCLVVRKGKIKEAIKYTKTHKKENHALFSCKICDKKHKVEIKYLMILAKSSNVGCECSLL